jgi:Domain of unknown function (DUF4272)
LTDAAQIREHSRKQVERLGYRFNPNLPFLDPIEITRTIDETVGRILALYACVACSYGFSKEKALNWLEQERRIEFLSEAERLYLEDISEAKRNVIQWQVEGLWALTWGGGYHEELDFSRSCPDSFIDSFPDLKTNASSDVFAQQCKLRVKDEITEMLDLAYCLHWAIRDQSMTGKPTNKRVPGQVIEERRRGLEWLATNEDWDHLSLDT